MNDFLKIETNLLQTIFQSIQQRKKETITNIKVLILLTVNKLVNLNERKKKIDIYIYLDR